MSRISSRTSYEKPYKHFRENYAFLHNEIDIKKLNNIFTYNKEQIQTTLCRFFQQLHITKFPIHNQN